MDDDIQARHLAFAEAVTGKGKSARVLRVIRCGCRTIVATAYAWSDGRRYLWIPPHPMRMAETGRFIDAPAVVAGLDDGDHWQTATICRCGNGTLLSCHGTNAGGFPDGAVVVRYSTKESSEAYEVGEAVASWSLEGTVETELLPGLTVRHLGRATTATVAP